MAGNRAPSRVALAVIHWNFDTGLKLRRSLMPVCILTVVNIIRSKTSIEYPFAKYNVQATAYTYSQDEYTRFLEGVVYANYQEGQVMIRHQDKDWTKEETDYLFGVVQEYDTRWHIIHDRYGYPGGGPRSLEVRARAISLSAELRSSQDLKDRYYSVCRKLVRNRPWAGDEASKAQLISSFQFDKGVLFREELVLRRTDSIPMQNEN